MTRLVWGVDRAPKPIRAKGSGLSADQRRTLRRKDMLARGIHPTTRRLLLDPGWEKTCKGCDWVYANRHNKTYWKCGQVAFTGGPGSDVRLSWPACVLYRES